MKSIIFWDMTPYSPLSCTRRSFSWLFNDADNIETTQRSSESDWVSEWVSEWEPAGAHPSKEGVTDSGQTPPLVEEEAPFQNT
jgi:hypothetical protein